MNIDVKIALEMHGYVYILFDVTEDCVNRYPDKDCDVWAKYDHCKINPLFMEANCMRSCKVCTDTSTGNTGGGGGGGNGGTGTTYPKPIIHSRFFKQGCILLN